MRFDQRTKAARRRGLFKALEKRYECNRFVADWVARKVEEGSAMPRAKRASKGKRPSKAVSVLGIAGVSFAASTGGSSAGMPFAPLAPAAGSVEDILWQNMAAPFQIPTLDEEEISDVSLATFSVYDTDLANPRSGPQLAAFRAGCGCGHGCGGCRGCGGVRACGGRACGFGCRGCGGWRGCGGGWRGCSWGGCGGCGGCGVVWGWGGGCCLSWGGCNLLC